MWKYIKGLLAVAVIGAATAAVIYATIGDGQQRNGRRGFRGGEDGPVPVVVAQARTADVPVYLEGAGTARARNTVTVRPQVDGRIISIDFKEGQEVKRGDVLARIDPATYQAQLDGALAKKALDEAQLANAKRDLERYTKLPTNVVSEKTVDTQRATVAQLEAQVQSDIAAIDNAKAILGYTTIVSPIDGRTGLRMVDVGNLVRASDAGIVVITEVRPISVLFTLPQQQLPRINKAFAQGPLSVVAMDVDSKTELDHGNLEVVDNLVDQTTGTVRLKADFPNTDYQLWPGQFVNVKLLIDTFRQVVVVPGPAVQRGPNGTFVYLVSGGEESTVSVRPIVVAHQTEKDIVVSGGLKAGDQVVTSGFARLQEGSRVKPQSPGDSDPAPAAAPRSDSGAQSSDRSTGFAARAEARPVDEQAYPARKRGERREGREGRRHGVSTTQ